MRGATRALATFAFAFATCAFGFATARAQVPPGAPPPAGAPRTPPPAPEPSPALPPPVEASPTVAASATPAAPTGRRLAAFSVDADRVAFYSNRYIVGADGHVDVRLGDGTQVTSNTFFMDLRLNRFVCAGDVKVTTSSGSYAGAAFSEYFDYDRAYFVPLTQEPDRWTYASGDYAHPLFGRQMPGDAFYLPDLAGERVFLFAKKAVIDPRKSVRFTPASLNFGLSYVPFPTYFLNFSPNPNFAQNSLPGADVDGPYDFAGGEHGLATAHVRYDSLDKVFFAYEQHQVSDRHYLVWSIDPLTRPLKQYNLLAFDRLSPNVQVQLQLQETAFQHAFNQPLSATAYGNAQITAALRHSYLQLNANSFYDSLLSQPEPDKFGSFFYGDPSHNWLPSHPNDQTLTWTGYRYRINHLPLFLQLRSSFGLAHQGEELFYDKKFVDGNPVTLTDPLQCFGPPAGAGCFAGPTSYSTIWNHAVGADLTTEAFKVIPDKASLRRDVFFTAAFDKQRQWFSVPHHVDTTLVSGSLSKAFDRQLAAVVSYQLTNTGDFYGAQQTYAYPIIPIAKPYFSPATGQTYPGYSAYRGFSTTRSLVEQFVYTPSTAIAFALSMRENHDFPAPIPGLVQSIGGTLYFNNYGFAPYQATADLRFRVNSVVVFDINRSYYFNFGGYERWSPQFNIQVLR